MKTIAKRLRVLFLTFVAAMAIFAADAWVPLPPGNLGWDVKTGPMAATNGILYAVFYQWDQSTHGWVSPGIRRYDTCSESWDVLAVANMDGQAGGAINALTINGDYL
jgi:hypothetical protein